MADEKSSVNFQKFARLSQADFRDISNKSDDLQRRIVSISSNISSELQGIFDDISKICADSLESIRYSLSYSNNKQQILDFSSETFSKIRELFSQIDSADDSSLLIVSAVKLKDIRKLLIEVQSLFNAYRENIIEKINAEKKSREAERNEIDIGTSDVEFLRLNIEYIKNVSVIINKYEEGENKIEKMLSEVNMKSSDFLLKIEELNSKYETSADAIAAYEDRIEKLYSGLTAVGLSRSFDERSARMACRVLWWTLVLILCLLTAGGVGLWKFYEISKMLLDINININLVYLNVMLSVTSLIGPAWLAWIASSQINQNFRLSEDYGFKAASAKAYEAYRREAMSYDSGLAQRLFSALLNRFEENPLNNLKKNKEKKSPLKVYMDKLSNIPEEKIHLIIDKANNLIGKISNLTKKEGPENH